MKTWEMLKKKFYFCAIEFLNTNMCRYMHVNNTKQGWILGGNLEWNKKCDDIALRNFRNI